MIKLTDDIDKISGVGKKKKELLLKLGIKNIKDLLENLPINYSEIKEPLSLEETKCGLKQYVKVKILGFSRIKKAIITKATDSKQYVELIWFNSPFIVSTTKLGMEYVAFGYVKKDNRGYKIIQPKLFSIQEYEKMIGLIIPTYSLTQGLTNNSLLKIIDNVFSQDITFDDGFDKELCNEYGLLSYDDALRKIHRPKNPDDIKNARKRFVFKELYTFMYRMKMLKNNASKYKNDFKIKTQITQKQIEDAMGFELTRVQKQSIDAINEDLKRPTPMSRLLQGDVGSGKTIVAFTTLLNTVLSGYQCAFMAPTEILAQQHYLGLINLIKKLNLEINVGFLTSSTTKKNKEDIYRNLKEGSIQVIIGTHSLIWKDVEYNNLAYVITDEQHRFGVNQRQDLAKKANNPHILVMSATPIPRTLAIMLYGDMDISIMDELPSKRIPIKNKVVNADYERAAYNLIKKEVDSGKKAYVVCPLVEESEHINCVDVHTQYEKLKSFYNGDVKVGLLHGQMTSKEKDTIMNEFKFGNIDVLVSTVVIEVGVDVSSATVMVIVDPQRFGLAQLHQLRGRVGRAEFQSYCVFLVISGDEVESKRLKILEKTNDGFEIAKQDLKLRGSGDIFGVRQSGDINFKFADIYEDSNLIVEINSAIDKYKDAGCDIILEKIEDTI